MALRRYTTHVKFGLILILFLSTLSVFAQQEFRLGYLITLDNKTEIGYIEDSDPFITGVCRYRKSVVSPIQEITADRILGFIYYETIAFFSKEKTYISVKSEENGVIQYKFYRQELRGITKLLSSPDGLGIAKDGEPGQRITARNFDSVKTAFFGTCPFLAARLNEIKFTKREVRWAIRQNNACAKSGAEDFRGIGETKVNIGIVASYDVDHLTFAKASSYPLISEQKPNSLVPFSAGIQAWLRFPYLAKRMSFRTGVIYKPQKFNMARQSNPSGSVQLNFDYTEIQIPFQIQYDLIKAPKNILYLRTGISFSSPMAFHSNQVTDTPSGSSIYIDESTPFTSFAKNPQWTAGLGTFFKVAKRQRIMIEISYVKGEGSLISTAAPGTISVNFNSISLTTGFLF